MPIDESQLETWSHQGAIQKASITANSVKLALNSYNFFDNNYKVYLQGSYKNDTNIYGESDVDVIIQFNSTFYHNVPSNQLNQSGISPATYSWDDYKNETLTALNKYFGSNNVKDDNKCIRIKKNDNRLPADVIVTCEYRNYYNYNTNTYISGVCFLNLDGNMIINYPNQVYDNGVLKQNKSNNWFKPLVRIFKNMRKNASIKGPSYYIQCLLYNIPNYLFQNNYEQCVYNILEYIRVTDDKTLQNFLCQHGQFFLFGNSSEQWEISNARQFNQGLIYFWNNWDN